MSLEKTPTIKVSIIIVSWNVAKLIDKCLNTLIRSLGDMSYEIFVVDNHSHDETCNLIKDSYPQVNLIESKENLGFPKANNLALKEASGEYIFFLNPDTEVRGQAVQTLIDKLDSNSSYGLVGPLLVSPNGKPQAVCARPDPSPFRYLVRVTYLNKFLPSSLQLPDLGYLNFDFKQDKAVDALNGAAMLCTKKLCDELGGMDDTLFMYLEDIDFCRRIRDLGYKVVMTPEAQIMHYEGQSSKQVPARTKLLMLQALTLFIQRYEGQIPSFAFKCVVASISLVRLPVALLFSILRSTPLDKHIDKFRLSPKVEILTLLWALGLKRYDSV